MVWVQYQGLLCREEEREREREEESVRRATFKHRMSRVRRFV